MVLQVDLVIPESRPPHSGYMAEYRSGERFQTRDQERARGGTPIRYSDGTGRDIAEKG